MKDKFRKNLPMALTAIFVVAVCLVFGFTLNQFGRVKQNLVSVAEIFSPILWGLVFAFLLNPLYNLIRNGLLSKKVKKGIAKAVATTVTVLFFLALVIGFILLLVPQLIDSLSNLVSVLPYSMKAAAGWLDSLVKGDPRMEETLAGFYTAVGTQMTNWLKNDLLSNLNGYFQGISTGVMSVLNVLKNLFIGLVVMAYVLNIKETLSAQAKKICYGWMSVDKANKVIDETRFIGNVFSRFIVGKIIDSMIIGVLTFVVISIMRMPYTLLISVIIGVTNIIPIFGPFIGAVPCAFIVFIVSPVKALQFVIAILIIQQLDGNVIGPRILGQTTGLSSFWILFSITVFAGFFGLFGMIIAVPTFAVIYKAIQRSVADRLEKKSLATDTASYLNLDRIDEETGKYIKHNDGSESDGKNAG